VSGRNDFRCHLDGMPHKIRKCAQYTKQFDRLAERDDSSGDRIYAEDFVATGIVLSARPIRSTILRSQEYEPLFTLAWYNRRRYGGITNFLYRVQGLYLVFV